MRTIYDWTEIQHYHDQGHGFVECTRRFGFSHTAWIKAIKRGGLQVTPARFSDRRRRYDWSEVQAYHKAGHTYAECLAQFGYTRDSWSDAARRGELTVRARALPIAMMMQMKMDRGSIKRRLLELGLLEERCSRCALAEWRGKRLTIHIDHINGVKDDWRLENLRMLCPNCHSQTPTFSGRNLRRALGRGTIGASA
ncbi:MAG: HNH endonuclease signature motif containing protein [Candidatus Baltobacteraceae bacterium]